MEVMVKNVMNAQEIAEWKKGKIFIPFEGTYNLGRWILFISFDHFKDITINVYGYNGIFFGKFELDNGCVGNEKYCPILRFYNQLSFTRMGWCDSDTLSSDVDFGAEEFCELNVERITQAVDDSWNKIKNFLS